MRCSLCGAVAPRLQPWHGKATCDRCVEVGERLEHGTPDEVRPLLVAAFLMLERLAAQKVTAQW